MLLCALIGNARAAASCLYEIQAHRGARPAIENSIESIRLAAGRFHAAEIDVQPLKDGAWALHHDFITGRVFQPAGLAPHLISSSDWAAGLLRPFGAKSAPGERPALFREAIEASNRYNIPLAIEIKYPASCSAVQSLYRQAGGLTLPPSWHTPFAEHLPCLAQLEAGDVGFVIGPDPEKAVAYHAKIPFTQKLALRAMKEAEKGVPGFGAEVTNRRYLTPSGIDELAGLMGRKRKRLIIPAQDLLRHSWLPKRASRAGLRLALYSESGLDRDISDILEKTGVRPFAIVADQGPAAFCR